MFAVRGAGCVRILGGSTSHEQTLQRWFRMNIPGRHVTTAGMMPRLAAALSLLLVQCQGSSKEKTVAHESSSNEAKAAEETALAFVAALTERAYDKAYALTSASYRARTTQQALRVQFERSCPPDYGAFDALEVVESMASWPDKRPGDLRWLYVSVGGRANEAVTVVVAREQGALKVSEVEVGRP